MTNTEKQALLFRLEQDKERLKKMLDNLDGHELTARGLIYASLRPKMGFSDCLSRSTQESRDLYYPEKKHLQNVLNSIEKHIEEIEAGS